MRGREGGRGLAGCAVPVYKPARFALALDTTCVLHERPQGRGAKSRGGSLYQQHRVGQIRWSFQRRAPYAGHEESEEGKFGRMRNNVFCAQTVLKRHLLFLVGQGVFTDVHGKQFVVSFDEKCKTIWDGPEPLIKV